MSEAQVNVSPLLPGPLVATGRAIAARLQIAFPPSKFKFNYMPAEITPRVWEQITFGNLPFFGLSFLGWKPVTEGRMLSGLASFALLCAVRGEQRTPQSLYYGDAQNAGLMSYAGVAAALLNGFVACAGTVNVTGIDIAIHPAWKDNSAVMALALKVPTPLLLGDAITAPGGLGMFEELATQWNVPVPDGSLDTYTSDWENPNE